MVNGELGSREYQWKALLVTAAAERVYCTAHKSEKSQIICAHDRSQRFVKHSCPRGGTSVPFALSVTGAPQKKTPTQRLTRIKPHH